MADSLLFRIETLVVDGVPLAIEDGSATLTGMAGFENRAVPAASGDDAVLRARVPRTVACKLLFNGTRSPTDFARHEEVQITGRMQGGGRRVLLTKCTFASLGAIGQGTVDVTYNVLSEPQWL